VRTSNFDSFEKATLDRLARMMDDYYGYESENLRFRASSAEESPVFVVAGFRYICVSFKTTAKETIVMTLDPASISDSSSSEKAILKTRRMTHLELII
jgi:hypothetical protein